MNRHIGQIEYGELHQVFREKRFAPRRRTRKDRIDGRREKKVDVEIWKIAIETKG
jgi:hypothetical protein